jgi:hypothetical protein
MGGRERELARYQERSEGTSPKVVRDAASAIVRVGDHLSEGDWTIPMTTFRLTIQISSNSLAPKSF